jgi:NDP-sugar pyrophosphorylase family protein
MAMDDSVAGVVLAAGIGARLSPLTVLRPKALCPVGGVALLDRALAALEGLGLDVAVNAHHHAGAVVAHVDGRARVAVEPVLLGTAGALANLRGWLDGRDALVVNADAVHAADLARLLAPERRGRGALLTADPEGTGLGPRLRLCGARVPWRDVAALEVVPSGLYDRTWRPAAAAGRLDVLGGEVPWFDCGTPASYLAANLWTSGGAPVVGEGAVVEGELTRSVVWDGSTVRRGEHLVDAVRAERLTVLVR